MDTSQELIEIWRFLERQERYLMELGIQLRALLEVLKSQLRLLDSYQSVYKGLESSKLILEHELPIREIHEKLQQLSEAASVEVMGASRTQFSVKPESGPGR